MNLLVPNVIAYQRQKQQRDHITKCFCWNVPISKLDQAVTVKHESNKLDELK